MTNPSKRAIGNNAEDIACQYLLELGWDIIERNYYAGHNEIDIIAKDEDIIVFIEVKMRSSTHFGLPIEHVNETKVFRIFKAAERWVQENECQHTPLRFDIIGILQKKNTHDLTHLKDAFR